MQQIEVIGLLWHFWAGLGKTRIPDIPETAAGRGERWTDERWVLDHLLTALKIG